jgi:hypothetical protein
MSAAILAARRRRRTGAMHALEIATNAKVTDSSVAVRLRPAIAPLFLQSVT